MLEGPVPSVEQADGIPAMDMGGIRLSFEPQFAKVVMQFVHPEASGRATFSVKGFDAFLRAASAYASGLDQTREILKDEPEAQEIPEHPEGECKNCGSSQILAEALMRKCKGCNYVWRVPPLSVRKFTGA